MSVNGSMKSNLSGHSYHWVNEEAELTKLIDHCLGLPFVAIDTEFERTSTYFANAGLIQIASEEDIWLIDPLAFDSLHALAPLLKAESVLKVLHSMSEDVELLRYLSGGTAPVSVFDTQVAASFLGLGPSLGYQKVVSEVFNVELEKGETRSDWLQRPLTDSQIEYAVEDSLYLAKLYPALRERLEAVSRYESCLNECEFLCRQQVQHWEQPELAYLKLRGAWSLNKTQQRLLQHLVVWRDRLSVSENVPKPWVIADAPLIEFAASQINAVGGLYKLSGIKPKSVKRYGHALLEERDEVLDVLQNDDPEKFTLVEGPIRGKELDVYKSCKSVISSVEKETGLPAQLLASRKNLEQLVVSLYRRKEKDLPAFFQGWRQPLLEDRLRKVFA